MPSINLLETDKKGNLIYEIKTNTRHFAEQLLFQELKNLEEITSEKKFFWTKEIPTSAQEDRYEISVKESDPLDRWQCLYSWKKSP